MLGYWTRSSTSCCTCRRASSRGSPVTAMCPNGRMRVSETFSSRPRLTATTPRKSGEILDLGHLVCIDTYCWGGGWLTALDTTRGQVWQVDRNGQQRR
jgi:hypothetical protein